MATLDSRYMSLLAITSIILFCWIILIIAWERVSPYRNGLTFFRDGFWVDLVWYTLIQSYVLKIVIFDYLIDPVQHHFDWSGFQFIKNWSVTEQVLFFLITHDLYIYLFHRLQHASTILWRTHEAHHSGKHIDFLAGSRSNALEIIINQTIEFAPIVILGADPAVVPIKAMLDAMFGMFIHANIDVKMGRLKYLFNSPELHLWHHANYQEVFHANFSTKFAIWDYLFKTAYDPGHKPGNLPQNWGLHYDFPKDYFLQHLFSFKRFDENWLKRYKWFKFYSELRPSIIDKIKGYFQSSKSATVISLQERQRTLRRKYYG